MPPETCLAGQPILISTISAPLVSASRAASPIQEARQPASCTIWGRMPSPSERMRRLLGTAHESFGCNHFGNHHGRAETRGDAPGMNVGDAGHRRERHASIDFHFPDPHGLLPCPTALCLTNRRALKKCNGGASARPESGFAIIRGRVYHQHVESPPWRNHDDRRAHRRSRSRVTRRHRVAETISPPRRETRSGTHVERFLRAWRPSAVSSL